MYNSLLNEYRALRESGSSSDFPNILGNVMYRSLIDWARNFPDAWRSYSAIGDAQDFRPQTRIVGYEAEDLLLVDENGNYVDSKLADAAYTVKLGTFGRAFSIGRQVIINDDLGYIRKQPQRFGRSAARSIAKFVPQTLLEGNLAAFDGTALFHANHGNLDAGATAINAAQIQKGITALQSQTVLGVLQPITARWLVVPPALQFTARQILNSAIIAVAGTAGTVTTYGTTNVLSGLLGIIVDPFLTNQTAYYVVADPNDVPILDVEFLQGKQTPDLLVELPTMQNLAGGTDPYNYEFDTLHYKVRYDYGGATSLWWGAYKFNGA